METILILTDYKDRFGSKHYDVPYRSGMDKALLTKYLKEQGFNVLYQNFSQIKFRDSFYKDKWVIYMSSEDNGYRYKSYIEDVVFSLEQMGAKILPSYKHLRANNNKVFMEILRDLLINKGTNHIQSYKFGTLEDLKDNIEKIKFPCVAKTAAGATGSGVYLAKNEEELIKVVKKIAETRNLKFELRDWLRSIKHSGYIRDSKYREKFIVQDFVPNLSNDWKIYVFGSKLYIFNRPIQPGRGIKASGGGYDNYLYGQEAKPPQGIFDFADNIFKSLDIPHASLDIAFDGKDFYLIEFQALYFGTAGIPFSKGYFRKNAQDWEFITSKLDIEKVWVDSIVQFISNEKI